MPPRHLVRRADEADFAVPTEVEGRGAGFRRWSLVDDAAGSVHMGFGQSVLEPGGHVHAHVHSYEQSFYVLEGEAVVDTPGASFHVGEGDYGVLPIGMPHAWRNPGERPARWADMLAPQPGTGPQPDTFTVPAFDLGPTVDVDPRDPRTRAFGHIGAGDMDPGNQTQDRLARSASMRTALLLYSGITVKMMLDTELGAQLQTMFMVQYEPGGFAGAHDHPLEEAYLILDGVVDATFDGETYRLGAGDVAWAGVGCVHAFSNPGDGVVRWLETQAPQPPARHSYRFARDWAYLADQLGPAD